VAEKYVMNNTVRINKILLPLAWFYGIAVALRNYLFDKEIFRSETFSVPVICIGNLIVGGTGKTPHTEYLIRLLSKKYKIAVLSRGYKRKTQGFVLADKNASALALGDEPFQMFRKFPEIIVATDSNRRRGINNLLALSGDRRPEVILLDDAFQHRWVNPSLSILLSDWKRTFYNDYLLPAGRLREPAKNYRRADIIIFTKCPDCHCTLDPDTLGQVAELPELPVFHTTFEYKELLPVFPAFDSIEKKSLERLKKEDYSVLLVTGLANPSDLIRYLKQYTNNLHSIVFPDHHNFSRRDIVRIEKSFKSIKNSRKILITSEKDAVRIMSHSAIQDEIKNFMYYIPVEVVFCREQEKLFIQKIENHVENFARNRIMA